ncbi:hypothetical protein GW17_00011461 [Ensete ventricosum]|nr:hypothetical protein GW17_00011461 [Ensete ventricosum]RZR95679.1 hypothetical protein BHM03_00024545 [Ensete ventricosum]
MRVGPETLGGIASEHVALKMRADDRSKCYRWCVSPPPHVASPRALVITLRLIGERTPITRAETATEMACLASLLSPRLAVPPHCPLLPFPSRRRSYHRSSFGGLRLFAPSLRSRFSHVREGLSPTFRAASDQQGPDEQKFLEASMAYVSGNPIMTDAEFDELKLRLKKEGSGIVQEGPRCSLRSRKMFLLNVPAAVIALTLFFFLDDLTGFEITYLLEVSSSCMPLFFPLH